MVRKSDWPPQKMKHATLAGAALGLSLVGVSPALAITEYLGGGFISVDRNCATFGWTGTHQVLLRLEPQGESGNAANETQMAILMNTGTIALRMNLNRGFRHTYSMDQAVYVWNGPHSPNEPTMQFTFNPDSDFPTGAGYEIERLNIRVYNFNEHAGCTARLYGSLVRN